MPEKTELEYFKSDLINMITTRYKNLRAFETIGVLDVVKF